VKIFKHADKTGYTKLFQFLSGSTLWKVSLSFDWRLFQQDAAQRFHILPTSSCEGNITTYLLSIKMCKYGSYLYFFHFEQNPEVKSNEQEIHHI